MSFPEGSAALRAVAKEGPARPLWGLNPRSERTSGVPDPRRDGAPHAGAVPDYPIRINNTA